jgi:PAS domain S-box-containing protein
MKTGRNSNASGDAIMTESIRILILEGNPADAGLVQFDLQEAGLTFTSQVVATEEAYVHAIQDDCPDLILSDYDLPGYNGALALAEAKRRCPGTPFILVTGAVTEDRAIDILTEGAKDYVLRERLQQRLVPAVRRALAEAAEHRARKRAEAELREAYQTVEENVRIRTAELEAEMAVRKRVEQEMVVIAEIGRIVTSTINLDEVYEAFALQVGKVLPFDRIVISIIRPDGKTTRSVYIAGEEIRERNKKDIYPIEGSGHAEMLRTKSTFLIQTEDFREYEDRFPRLRSTFQAGFRSMMNVPLFYKGEIIGALLLRSRKYPAYSEADVRLAERIGTQIAGAIANAQLFNNLSEMERALREITERLHLATASAKAGVWDWNLETGEMIWDERMLELYGLNRENFPGGIETWEKGLHPEDSSRAIEEFRAALRGERDFDTEFRIRRHDGTVVHIKANGIVLRDEAGKPLRMIGLNIDITEREQSVEALQDSEERHRRIVEALNDAVLLHANDKIFYANPAALKLFRANDPGDLLGKSYLAMVHPDDRAMSIERMKKNRDENWIAPSREHRVLTLDGQPVHVESVGVPIKYRGETQVFAVFRDISNRRRAEEERAKLQDQLLQSQKMESVGRLAGGVAHDFNNMLGVILGHAEMAMEQVDPNQPLHANLEEIRKAANHSADLTRQLLAFARKQVVSPKILDLNETVAGMLKMLQRLIGEDIQLAWLPGANLWPVNVDPAQIDQILANLSVNARDAIAGVGKLTIETQNVRFDAAYGADHAGCVPGDYVMLSVGDDGCGMDREILSHLFEPFFTTKETGKGTGLGLAMVYGIVKQNNGFIDVSSELGRGTAIRVYLPRHIGKSEQIRREGSQEPITRGHETVLVVEDEAALLDLSRIILEKQGYHVLAASTPGEAIRLAKDHPGEIDLLLTDVVMPEMNGRELAKIILSLYPNMKRLFMSGYTADVIAHRGVLDNEAYFIQKPFSRKELAVKVREVLGRAG